MEHMINKETKEHGIKRVRVGNQVFYPFMKEISKSGYQREFKRHEPKDLSPAKVHNVEIDANEIMNRIRLKNDFK
jgi:hypothetical protein